MMLEKQDFISALGDSAEEPNILPDELWSLYQSALHHARLRGVLTYPLEDLMVNPVITVRPDAPLSDAANLMLEYRISGLPVVEQEKLVGIITEGDLLVEVGIPVKPPKKQWHQQIFDAWCHVPRPFISSSHKVRDIMTCAVITAAPEDTLGCGLALMRKHQVSRVVVVDNQSHVQGIMTRSDILRFTSAGQNTRQQLLPEN